MFLCDSTDARRSGLALSGYWDGASGSRSGWRRLLASFPTNVSGSWGEGSQNCVKQTCGGNPSPSGPPRRFKVNLRCSGSRRKIAVWIKEAFITCSRTCPVFAIWFSIKLHLNKGFFAPRRPAGRWNIMHLFYCAGKNAPSSSWKCKKCASSTFTLQHVPDLESVKTSSGNAEIKAGWPCYAFSHNCAFQFRLNGGTKGVGMKVGSVFQSPAL